MSKIHKAMAVAMLAAGAAVLPSSAQATQATQAMSTASASLGEADIVVGGTPAQAAPIAPCDVAGPTTNSSSGTLVGSTTEFGRGETSCGRSSDGTSSAEATGQRFETKVLRQFGGPTIRVRTYSAECRTTAKGSSGYVELGGVSGFTVPSDIQPNHTLTIPGANPGDKPMARIVLNELVVPSLPDGSLTTHTLRIVLFPDGGPASGDIVLGTASCDPFGG